MTYQKMPSRFRQIVVALSCALSAASVGISAQAQAVFISNVKDNMIQKIDSNGVATLFNVGNTVSAPSGIVFDNQGYDTVETSRSWQCGTAPSFSESFAECDTDTDPQSQSASIKFTLVWYLRLF